MVPSAFGDESPAFGDQCRVVCIKAGGVLSLRSLLQSGRFEDGFGFRQTTRYAV